MAQTKHNNLAWRVGGPQGSGVDTAARIFYDKAPPALRPIADAQGRPTADLNPFYKEMMIES